MSAPNFMTMENFSLFVHDTPYCKICPECNSTCGENDDKCNECGADISDVQVVYDEILDSDIVREMEAAASKINKELDIFKVSVESGYYSGHQFFVTTEKDSPELLTNEECKEYWAYDMCRSKAIRKYNAEIRKINKWLKKTGKEMGLVELVCLGRFSNGEAVYSIVKDNAPTVRQAAKMVA